MSTRRVLIHLAWVAAVGLIACVVVNLYWQRRLPVVKNSTKIVAAVNAFSRDEKAAGREPPATVTLPELVRRGYLRAEETRPFDGMQVTISLAADETQPQGIVMRARMSDGATYVILGDGSAQQVSPRAVPRQ